MDPVFKLPESRSKPPTALLSNCRDHHLRIYMKYEDFFFKQKSHEIFYVFIYVPIMFPLSAIKVAPSHNFSLMSPIWDKR